MASPGSSSLLNRALEQPQSFGMYSSNSEQTACLGQQLEEPEGAVSCHAFCQPLFLGDFHPVVPELQSCTDMQNFSILGSHGGTCSNPTTKGSTAEERLSARKVHKADREKLRRDKLNEHFAELARALDPDRPKNDKATVLGESVQVFKDLQAEVKRLKTEHTSLLTESHDLTQEKNELREEKTALKHETEQLQSQLQQRMNAMSPWMAMDPSLVMGPTPFQFPAAAMPVPAPVPSTADSHQATTATPPRPIVAPPRPIVAPPPPPYISLPPPIGVFHLHPSLQAYVMFGNRHADGTNPYLPFPSFAPPPSVTSHSHVERPYAQYPSSVQTSVPGYAVHLPGQGSQPQVATTIPRPCVAGIPVLSSQSSGPGPGPGQGQGQGQGFLSQTSKASSQSSHTSQSSHQPILLTDLQLQTPSILAQHSQRPQASDSATMPDPLLDSSCAESRIQDQVVVNGKENLSSSHPVTIEDTVSSTDKVNALTESKGIVKLKEEKQCPKDVAEVRN